MGRHFIDDCFEGLAVLWKNGMTATDKEMKTTNKKLKKKKNHFIGYK